MLYVLNYNRFFKAAQYAFFVFTVIFFIIPPLFVAPKTNLEISVLYSPLTLITYICMCILLYTLTQKSRFLVPFSYKKNIFLALLSFIILCGFTFILQKISVLFFTIDSKTIQNIVLPQKNPVGFIFLFFGICVFACFEELLYRFYFPSILHRFLPILLAEIIPIVLFALAHRYLGILAVINAFFAAVVFRFCVKKTGTVWSTCLIHSVYNMLIIIDSINKTHVN